jgi:oligoendopeptidase F
MMQKHLESYLGKGVAVHPDDGNSFVYISHFRYGFYVYTYTYGLLMSNMMHVKLSEDPSYVKQIDAFLTSGNRAPVETIFKDIGIDPLKVATFVKALDLHEADINAFNKLSSSLKNK